MSCNPRVQDEPTSQQKEITGVERHVQPHSFSEQTGREMDVSSLLRLRPMGGFVHPTVHPINFIAGRADGSFYLDVSQLRRFRS